MTTQATSDPKQTPPATPPASGATKPDDAGNRVPLAELMKEREKRQTLEAERDGLKQALMYAQQQGAPRYPAAPQPVAPVQQASPVAADMQRLWQEDPQRAVQAEIMMAINWMDNVSAGVDHQEAQAASKYSDYDQYRNQIRGYMRTIPIAQRSQPGVIDAAYYFVKGQSVDTVVKQAQEDLLRKIRNGEAIQGFETPSTPPPPQQQTLTEDQKRVAVAMGMSPEDYQKYRK